MQFHLMLSLPQIICLPLYLCVSGFAKSSFISFYGAGRFYKNVKFCSQQCNLNVHITDFIYHLCSTYYIGWESYF